MPQRHFMQLCIHKAWEYQTLTLPNPAVGALITDKNGGILSLQAHRIAGGAHAEVLAFQEAYAKITQDDKIMALSHPEHIHEYLMQNHGGIFHTCCLYVSLEPCHHYGKTPPCSKLIATLKPKAVFIGAEERYHTGGITQLKQAGIEVRSGILPEACQDLLLPFIKLQTRGCFVLFKLATRLDGDYKSGIISCVKAREFTHNQRTRAKSITISYNTLMHDNPRLDCRFAKSPYHEAKIPDVYILSRQKQVLQKDLSIFLQPREVRLLQTPIEYEDGFHIIEGGWKMLEILKDQVDMILLHLSPTLRNSAPCGADFDFQSRILHTQILQDDWALWLANS